MKANKLIGFSIAIFTILIMSTFASAEIFVVEENTRYCQTSQTEAKWTVMIYFASDSHRGYEYNYILDTIKQIGSNKDLNIVGLFDTMKQGDTSYYYIQNDFLRPKAWYPAESNMADKHNFESFLTLSMNDYPAEHYALFTLSAWGSGWQGIFSDTHGTGSGKTLSLITMPEVSEVLKKVTNDGQIKIDVYGIDVCIPGTIEVAYEIAPYVNYMVANEEHGFDGPDAISDSGKPLGWNYSYYLQQLHDNPDMSPEEFAKLITNSYIPGKYTPRIYDIFNAPSFYPLVIYRTDLATTDLAKLENLKIEFNKLADILIGNLSECRNDIRAARAHSREYGKLYKKFWFLPARIVFGAAFEPFGYDAFIDLYDFVDKLQDESSKTEIINTCENIKLAFNEAVIANNRCEDDSSYGLSLYFPQYRCQYDESIWRGLGNPTFEKIPAKYEEQRFCQDTLWDEFVRDYLRI